MLHEENADFLLLSVPLLIPKDRVRSISFVGESASLILAQHQQRRFAFLEEQQGKKKPTKYIAH